MDAIQKLPTENLRQKYGGKIPMPVVSLARDLGIQIYETDDFDNSQSGSIVREDGNYIIYVNIRHSPRRKRFTIAHEIGHFLLHKNKLEKGDVEIVDTIKNVAVGVSLLKRADENKNNEEEFEANDFAADLLMPKEEFIKSWNKERSIEEIAEKFKVSQESVLVRASVLSKYNFVK